MNETLRTMESRRSIRSYKPDPIPDDILREILQAGLNAPSGRNCQSPIIIVITDTSMRRKIAEENAKIMGRPSSFDPFYGAPAILLVAALPAPTAVYDGTCTIMNLMNAAWSLGIGSCWIHRAKEELESPFGKDLLQSLGLPNDCIGIGHVALGYPSGTCPEAKGKNAGRIYRI